MTSLPDTGFLDIGSHRLEYRWIGPRPEAAPTLVLLHEGLGCVGMWGSFPEQLAEATGCGVFMYSRAGYGQSSPAALPRPLNYMTDEAHETLPKVLDAIGFRRGLLVGHSDGASIALIHASRHDVTGLALLAPHVFVEEITVEAIRETRRRYADGDLRDRMRRHHDDVDAAFWGWCDVWLAPAFHAWNLEAEVERVAAPTLLVQGGDDPYGTLEQLDRIEARASGPVRRLVVPGGHSPHLEAAEETLAAIADFTARLA
jgi:pimeloyl-ACP methyl ester carboxylesterase